MEKSTLCAGMYVVASSMHPKRRSENVRRQVIYSSRGKMRKMRTPIFNAQLPKKKQKQMFTKREYRNPTTLQIDSLFHHYHIETLLFHPPNHVVEIVLHRRPRVVSKSSDCRGFEKYPYATLQPNGHSLVGDHHTAPLSY